MAVVKPGVINNWELMERQVLFYRDHLDIFIEEQFAPIKLTPTQKIIAREFGRSDDMKTVCSRGYGKTFIIALCCFAMCSLYPGTLVAVCSGTAQQATLVFQKLKMDIDTNDNMRKELDANGARSLIQLSKDKGKCYFKNGSSMESFALTSMRGQRAKIVVIDEALEMNQADLDAIVSPLKNFKRIYAYQNGIKDFPSKSIAITSACEKSNDFYEDFKRVVRNMAAGAPGAFACALDYNAAIHDGITDKEFFEKEKARMPQSVFDMEYGSIFLGATNNSVFPYGLTDACRTLEKIELCQPKSSKSRYVISLDIATSEAKGADNSIVSVLKFTERTDGSFSKKLVYIRSFHGKGLDVLSNEIRILFHKKFPNTERIIYDARGLGDAFSKFFADPWIDPESGKEFPPLVHDDESVIVANAMPVLHAIRAVQILNQRIATNLRVMLEKRTIELPVNSRILQARKIDAEHPDPISRDELAVFIEADALQFEMGNIVCKISQSGNAIYDVPRTNMHKDRYSSLAYGADYIAELEQANIKKLKRNPIVIGFASNF